MAFRHYTVDQLHALRESPLCQRPDNLQPIESYLDEGSPQAIRREDSAQKQRMPKLPGAALAPGQESSPMGSFSTGRPTLPTRGSALRGNGEDVSLGPPRTMFPSSRNVPKLHDVQGKSQEDLTPADEGDSTRSRFFSERQLNRRSMNEKESGETNSRDWANVRDRRGQREGGSREEKDDGDRRNGYGNRHDPRWGSQRDDKQNGERRGGWREREARRDRDQDRHDKEPEWLDEPVVKQEKELGLGMARTQDEFQKWKESMSKKSKGEPDKEESVEPTPAPEPTQAAKPRIAPLKLEGFDAAMFGGWGNVSSSTPQSATTPSAGAGKGTVGRGGKTSRFASMFKPTESEPAPAPPPLPAVEPTPHQVPANGTSKTSAEDHEGFNRVLAMLGSAKIGQPVPPATAPAEMPASPPPTIKPQGANVTMKKSRFTDMFSQKSPERLQSPQQGGVQLGDSVFRNDGRPPTDEPRHDFNEGPPQRQQSEQQMPRTQEPAAGMSPAPNGIPFNALREQQPRPSSSRNPKDMYEPPSRGAASPSLDTLTLLAQQKRPQNHSNDSQMLLSLLKTTSRPQSQQALPNNGGIDQGQLHHLLEMHQRSSVPPQEPHAPKPRVPQQPPGLFEEQLMRNYAQEQPQQQQQLYGMPEAARRSQQRAPPGFNVHDEHLIHLQQQQQHQLRRQQYSEPPQPPAQLPGPGRRMSGHPSLPPMQIPSQQFPPDLHHLTSPGGAPPPPGFGPQMPRQPPGFPHNMTIFPGGHQEQRGPPPPGFAGMQSPLGNAPPPGFYGAPQGLPPGFQQAQQIRLPIDGMPPAMRFQQNGAMGGGRPI
ncbi:hypothetical protein DOTSEDRAFT_74119 [Dothistroma septosporum NZE10]|uniref:Uncharacterized protein n=1 Tax=Dothistroma septosporum (strain NZE10 / CBS 128990) TaxID=675120 RepID=N1PFR6_DOTSN|nr:hypothetical protein DOTSEDRAFT_74119 [Dothistroma septosporum NZE10]